MIAELRSGQQISPHSDPILKRMGRLTRGGTHYNHPRASGSARSKQIPDIFKTQNRRSMAGAKMARAQMQEENDDFDNASLAASEDLVRDPSPPELPLTYAAMMDIAADIKKLFSAAITDLKADILMLTEQMAAGERAGRHREKAIKRLEEVSSTHSQRLIASNRHLEDLDNRGRRSNIRIRGIPETVTANQIKPALCCL